MKQLLVPCLIVCLFAGCTTLQPIAGTPTELAQHFSDGGSLKPGDRVIVTTIQGEKLKFVVQSVHDEPIYGDGVSIPFADIAVLQKRAFSATKTAILVVVIIGAVAGVVGAAASHAAPAFRLE